MRFKFFPNVQFFDFDHSKPEDEVGDVGKEIKDLSKHRPDLYLRVKSFLKVLSSAVDLMPFLQNEQIYRFPKEYEGLYEMRIPKQARGVFRTKNLSNKESCDEKRSSLGFHGFT